MDRDPRLVLAEVVERSLRECIQAVRLEDIRAACGMRPRLSPDDAGTLGDIIAEFYEAVTEMDLA